MTDTDQTEDPMRAFARALFNTEQTEETDETAEAADETGKPTGNVVPNEGNISQPKDNSDKQFVRDLFN